MKKVLKTIEISFSEILLNEGTTDEKCVTIEISTTDEKCVKHFAVFIDGAENHDSADGLFETRAEANAYAADVAARALKSFIVEVMPVSC